MSTRIAKINDLTVSQFYGGDKRGPCLQLTSPDRDGGWGYSQLDAREVEKLRDTLEDWLRRLEVKE